MALILENLKKLTNQTNRTTDPADVSELTVSLLPGQTIQFEAVLIVSSEEDKTGLRFVIRGPQNPLQVFAKIQSLVSGGINTIHKYETYQEESSGSISHRPVLISGYIINNLNSGTFAIRWKSSTPTTTTVHKNSWLQYTVF